MRRGGVWGIRWLENGRRRFRGGLPDEDTARRVLAKILVDVAEGRKPDAPDPKTLPPLRQLVPDWIERRELTHRSWRDDRNRWNKHLEPYFGACKPSEVDALMVRRFIDTKLAAGLTSTTVRHLVALLSNIYTDLIERGYATANPPRALPRSARRLIRNAHDPRTTPFIEKQDDVRRVFLALAHPWAALFAISALAGLRPGEALALEWADIDLRAGRVFVQRQVRHGRVGRPKSGKPRPVPLLPALVKILQEFKLATGGAGRLFPAANPMKGGERGDGAKFLDPAVMQAKLREALKACGLPSMTWYSAGRHTFGSHHVLSGKSLETLREILGHSTVQVTERYGHLRVDLFKPSDLMTIAVDFTRPGGEVVELAAHREIAKELADGDQASNTAG